MAARPLCRCGRSSATAARPVASISAAEHSGRRLIRSSTPCNVVAADGVLSACARERVSLFIAHGHRAAIALTTHCRVASDAGAIQCWSENIVYGFDWAMIKALTTTFITPSAACIFDVHSSRRGGPFMGLTATAGLLYVATVTILGV